MRPFQKLPKRRKHGGLDLSAVKWNIPQGASCFSEVVFKSNGELMEEHEQNSTLLGSLAGSSITVASDTSGWASTSILVSGQDSFDTPSDSLSMPHSAHPDKFAICYCDDDERGGVALKYKTAYFTPERARQLCTEPNMAHIPVVKALLEHAEKNGYSFGDPVYKKIYEKEKESIKRIEETMVAGTTYANNSNVINTNGQSNIAIGTDPIDITTTNGTEATFKYDYGNSPAYLYDNGWGTIPNNPCQEQYITPDLSWNVTGPLVKEGPDLPDMQEPIQVRKKDNKKRIQL